ncbi:MAG: hypothetical protein MI749_09615 [Desulfovibrionales bacterium]|nr:hypothetical protein [Desulfovibrionales bacterium]
MKKFVPLLITAVLSCALYLPASAKMLRLGYLEAGPFWTYTESLTALMNALQDPGMASKMNWRNSVTIPQDARFSPGWGNTADLNAAATDLMSRRDLDLILVAGTDATAAILKANNGKTPIVSFSVADALKSGFVASETDSGVDNFTVRLVPGRYKKMFKVFYDIVGYKRLGIMYHPSESGMYFSNVADARAVAAEEGYELVEYDQLPESEDTTSCQKGLDFLFAKNIDAYFIGPLLCFDWTKTNVTPLIDRLIEQKVATFAREGTPLVQRGGLMGFSTVSFSERGRFLAERVIQILEGASPRSLSMIDNAIPQISLNLLTAEEIGFNPPLDLLAASDEVFLSIDQSGVNPNDSSQ